jgi:Tfp pilus assembly PilM family ATPase
VKTGDLKKKAVELATKLRAALRRSKGARAVIGFDGGHHAVKVIRLLGHRPPFRIEDAFVEIRGPESEAGITKIVRERGFLRVPAAFSLADESVDTHAFKLPKLEEEELETAINWELKKTLASPDFVYHDVLKYPTPTGVDVECVVASRDVVNAVYDSAEQIGVAPAFLETESSALLACVRAVKTDNPHRLAVLDLGHSSFRLIFLHGGRVSLTRSLYFGLGTLAEDAESANVTGYERPVQEGLYNLCEEFRRSEFFAKDKKGLEEIEEVVLCGGGAVLKPVVAYLGEHLSEKKISVLNPFDGTPQVPPAIAPETGPLWAVAVGLALREAA